jgi:hypothetical protein
MRHGLWMFWITSVGTIHELSLRVFHDVCLLDIDRYAYYALPETLD